VTVPPPDDEDDEDEDDDEDDGLAEADTPEEDETPEGDAEARVPEELPEDDELWADEAWVPDVEPLVDSCEEAVMCANLAPTRVAAAAESRPTVQVIFLTRRRPVSLARRAAIS
jgi:hypothetical protein